MAHPSDVCKCGDYRLNHEDGTGACCFNIGAWGMGSGHHGAPDCNEFRLAHEASGAEPQIAWYKENVTMEEMLNHISPKR